jgi:hypothetical protein
MLRCQWLNRNPVCSPPGRCIACSSRGHTYGNLLPYGTEQTAPGCIHCWKHGTRRKARRLPSITDPVGRLMGKRSNFERRSAISSTRARCYAPSRGTIRRVRCGSPCISIFRPPKASRVAEQSQRMVTVSHPPAGRRRLWDGRPG